MIDYRYLKAFKLTVQYQSFSKASKELKIAQSAVSRQIKLLEEGLGEELIIRTSKNFVLSSKGQKLFDEINLFEQKTLGIFKNEDELPITIGILQGLVINWFPNILSALRKHTKRDIQVSIKDINDLKSGVENLKYDVVFGTLNLQSDLLSSLKIFEENYVLISHKKVNAKTVHQFPWIVFGPFDPLYNLKYHKPYIHNPGLIPPIMTIDSMAVMIQMAINGDGIAAVPGHILFDNDTLKNQKEIILTPFEDIDPNFKSSAIYMTTLSYKKYPKRIQELKNLIPIK